MNDEQPTNRPAWTPDAWIALLLTAVIGLLLTVAMVWAALSNEPLTDKASEEINEALMGLISIVAVWMGAYIQRRATQ